MAYTISSGCSQCGICLSECPTGAIQKNKDNTYWVEPGLCNNCEDQDSPPACFNYCPEDAPVPLPAKKGRYKVDLQSLPTHYLFADGYSNSMSSAMVIWEACNILAKGQIFPWQVDDDGKVYFERQVKQGKGNIGFRLTDDLISSTPNTLSETEAMPLLESMDIRSTCLHLIFAASITALEKPWEQEFVLNNQQIETYLGLDKRRDLSKASKLTLVKTLVQQPCQLIVNINWFAQGKIQSFSVSQDRIWHLVAIENHFQEDAEGYKHLVGMTFKLRAGMWSKYFLNKQGYKDCVAYYQYGVLPKFLLSTVMGVWHQHEGAVRIMLWLLFKSRMGREQCITVSKLMSVAYSQAKVREDSCDREKRKRLIRRFESDLEALVSYNIKPVFDPITYPTKIQPLWSRLADIPEDGDESLEFWINDANSENSITDSPPPGKWNLLMKARILQFEFPPEWNEKLSNWENKKQRKTNVKKKFNNLSVLDGEQIANARKSLGISQRKLAEKLGKSQSWIRDLEKGRFSAKYNDRVKITQILNIK